eukprot:1674538-Amphidinium_carterae.1
MANLAEASLVDAGSEFDGKGDVDEAFSPPLVALGNKQRNKYNVHPTHLLDIPYQKLNSALDECPGRFGTPKERSQRGKTN